MPPVDSSKRLDRQMVAVGLVQTRSQAESYIKLGLVKVDGQTRTRPGFVVKTGAKITLGVQQQFVSRAALKLASVTKTLALNFSGKTVLDVGSSTGGFTQFALINGAKKVIAVDVGTDQMHPSLRGDARIELHEQTDIRSFKPDYSVDIIVVDVSFISVREILPHLSDIAGALTEIVVMLKPQFEAGDAAKHKGIIKNDAMRRKIIKDFELWARRFFVIGAKADSQVSGAKGNVERFYLLRKIAHRQGKTLQK